MSIFSFLSILNPSHKLTLPQHLETQLPQIIKWLINLQLQGRYMMAMNMILKLTVQKTGHRKTKEDNEKKLFWLMVIFITAETFYRIVSIFLV